MIQVFRFGGLIFITYNAAPESSYIATMRRNPRIWVVALLKRAGKRARRKRTGKRVRRKAELLTNAGMTAEGAQDEVVRSLAQGLVAGAWMKAHHIASGGERGGSAGAVLFIRRAIP